MKILVVAPEGMYQRASNSFIHNQLVEVAKDGHQVMVIIPIAVLKRDYKGSRIGKTVILRELDGINICYVRHLSLSAWGKDWINVISARYSVMAFGRKMIKSFLPDIVWVHTFGFGEEIGKVLKKYLKVPLLLTTHGGDTECALKDGSIMKTLESAKKIDKIVCVSPKLQRNLNDKGIWNTECIINGFQVKNRKDGTKNRFQIVQIGHLIESKHNDITIDTLHILREQGYDFELIIIGEGSKKGDLLEQVKNCCLEKKVRFLGELDNKDVMSILAEAQFFVMPSYPEGLGIVYLEAMGSKCIAIGTKGEGIDGIIRDGENGFLIERNRPEDIADTIINCINDERLMQRISDNAYKTAIEYSWEKNAHRNIEVMGRLISKD